MKKPVRLLAFALVLLTSVLPVSVFASEDGALSLALSCEKASEVAGEYTFEYLSGFAGSSEADWLAISLADIGAENAPVYAAELERRLESGELEPSLATDYMRLAMALKATGGTSYTALLDDGVFYNESLGARGANDYIWAILSVEYCGVPVPGDAVNTPDLSAERLASCELESGGFALIGTSADADVTALAVRALALFADEYRPVIDRSLATLSSLQGENGAFSSMGTVNAESTAQVIAALAALGLDPRTESGFIKNGLSCLDALADFMTAGGFSHTAGGRVNLLATAQALSALRLLYGDGLTVSAAGTQFPESFSPDENTAVSDTASASSAPARSDGGTGGVITVVVVAVFVAVALSAYIRVRLSKQYEK